MTDEELLARKLAYIETRVSELQRLGRPDLLRTDIKEERYVTCTLQIAIQAALDAASHIVSSERLEEPKTNRDLFALLSGDGWISGSLKTCSSTERQTCSGSARKFAPGWLGADAAATAG